MAWRTNVTENAGLVVTALLLITGVGNARGEVEGGGRVEAGGGGGEELVVMLFCERETLLCEPNCAACCDDCLTAGVSFLTAEREGGLKFQNTPVRVS